MVFKIDFWIFASETCYSHTQTHTHTHTSKYGWCNCKIKIVEIITRNKTAPLAEQWARECKDSWNKCSVNEMTQEMSALVAIALSVFLLFILMGFAWESRDLLWSSQHPSSSQEMSPV